MTDPGVDPDRSGETATPPAEPGRPHLPEVSRDETAEGWGDLPDPDDDFYLRERPPHHLG